MDGMGVGGGGGIGGSGGDGGVTPVSISYIFAAFVLRAPKFGTFGPSKHARNTKHASYISVMSENSARLIPLPCPHVFNMRVRSAHKSVYSGFPCSSFQYERQQLETHFPSSFVRNACICLLASCGVAPAVISVTDRLGVAPESARYELAGVY